MKKLAIIIALLASCATTSFAQMEHFLPKYYGYAYGFNPDLFRFPIEKENYDVCALMDFSTGYYSREFKTAFNHESIEFTGHLINSSVTQEMVDLAIKGALKEAGIKDYNEFYDYVIDMNYKLHALEYDEKQAIGEMLGVAAVGFSAGALLTESAIASAIGTATGAVGSALTTRSAGDVAMGAGSAANGIAGQIASAKNLEKLAGGSAVLGGVLDGVQAYQMMMKSHKEFRDRMYNRKYAKEMGRVYGFYRYFNLILNNLAQSANATHWLIVLDENQLPSGAGVGGIPVSVVASTATTLFKIDNADDAKYKLRRSFEGRYSGYLKLSMIYDMTNYDAHFVPEKSIFAGTGEAAAKNDFGGKVLDNSRAYGGTDNNDFAEGTRGMMGMYKYNYVPAFKPELKWDLNEPTKFSLEYDVPVTCKLMIKPGVDINQMYSDLEPLSEGDVIKGYEKWGPVKKTFVKPEISINKSMEGVLVPNSDPALAPLSIYVGAKAWTENGRLYEDSYEVNAHEPNAKSLAKFHTSKELTGYAFEDIFSEKTTTMGIYVDLRSSSQASFIKKDVVDKEFADKMHEIMESSYWNITVKK